jgi:hypothetical protein
VLLIMIAIVVVPYLRYNSKQQAYRWWVMTLLI